MRVGGIFKSDSPRDKLSFLFPFLPVCRISLNVDDGIASFFGVVKD